LDCVRKKKISEDEIFEDSNINKVWKESLFVKYIFLVYLFFFQKTRRANDENYNDVQQEVLGEYNKFITKIL